jgi:hypothetical protein
MERGVRERGKKGEGEREWERERKRERKREKREREDGEGRKSDFMTPILAVTSRQTEKKITHRATDVVLPHYRHEILWSCPCCKRDAAALTTRKLI